MGAEHVLNSSTENWESELAELAKKFKARVCLECVAGDITGRILSQMPSKSISILYGALSQQDLCSIDPLLMIGRDQRIEGWILGKFLKTKGIFGLLSFMK